MDRKTDGVKPATDFNFSSMRQGRESGHAPKGPDVHEQLRTERQRAHDAEGRAQRAEQARTVHEAAADAGRQRVADLTVDLVAARNTISSLQAEVRQLRNEAASAPGGTSAESQRRIDDLTNRLRAAERNLQTEKGRSLGLEAENRRLRAEAGARPEAGRGSRDPDLAALGIDPAFISSLSPDQRADYVKRVYKGASQTFHTDKPGTGDPTMAKQINIAFDRLKVRFNIT